MEAVAYYQSLPIDRPEALADLTLLEPTPDPRDLFMKVRTISVNLVDVKVRLGMPPVDGQSRVLGWDAAGVVRAVGAEVSLLRPGDAVWYAGALQRLSTNSELHVVDEHVVGAMPATLGFAQAAVLPLTAITAWELFFDRLQVPESAAPSGKTVLIVGATGGVGPVLVRLARRLTGLTVIDTASRPETVAWVCELGAHHVINHAQPLAAELHRIGVPTVDYVVSLNQTEHHFEQIVEALRPQGRLALTDDPAQLDVRKLKAKSLSLHWEFIYTRSMFGTDDQIEQHRLLNRVATFIDGGALHSTMNEHFGTINAANLKRAQAFIESNQARGEIVLEGF